MKNTKILSIIVPAYNVELYLERCLDSITYHESIIDSLDILIVNDGSSDNTQKIAEQYVKKYPKSIKLINKENGGHGSAINTGIAKATGTYLRILDADDWYNIIDFKEYVSRLANETADIVCTNYHQDFLYDTSIIKFDFKNYPYNQCFPMTEAAKSLERRDFFFQFSIPAMAVKLSALKKVWGEGIMEKTFYVDQCYITKVLSCAKTFIFYNLDIYRYFVGRPNQSVSSQSFFAHRLDHEKVIKWLIKFKNNTDDSTLTTIYERQILLMLETHFGLYTSRKLTKNEKKEILAFRNWLEKQNPKYINVDAAKRLSLKLTIPGQLYIKMLQGE